MRAKQFFVQYDVFSIVVVLDRSYRRGLTGPWTFSGTGQSTSLGLAISSENSG